jgi:uncharacterized protein YjbJ (UPF0337 family)
MNIMKNFIEKASWNEVKDKLKQNYGSLNDGDLQFTEGKEEELLDRLERKTGLAREDLKKWIEFIQEKEKNQSRH